MTDSVLLDTSIVSVFLKISPVHAERRAAIEQAILGRVPLISFVTVAEIYYWAETRNWQQRRKGDLEKHLKMYVVLEPTRDTAAIWAATKYKAKSSGIHLQPNDLWIAASALEYGVELISADADFDRIEGLTTHNL